jgi:dipeptidyl aminopeptidase/acylaminoacyl peptidase
VHVSVNAKHDGYDTSLWMIASNGGTPRQLTAGPRDLSPRWSPDGKSIAFLRSAESKEKPAPAQIYLLPMSGGEARALTDVPKGAGAPVWSPDGHFLVFTSVTKDQDVGKKKDDKAEEESDVRVITKAAYRNNGSGYAEAGRPSHIWSVEVPEIPGDTRKAKQVTTGEFNENDPVWARDSSRIFFTTERVAEPYYEPGHEDIYSIARTGGETRKIAGLDGRIGSLSLSPAGSRLAFVGFLNKGSDGRVRSYSQPDLWVVSIEQGSAPRNLTADYDYDIGSVAGGDQTPPRGAMSPKPYWSEDGRTIYVASAEEGRTNLKRIDAVSGKVESLTTGDQNLLGYSATPDGTKVVMLISTTTNIGDLYLASGSGEPRRLTQINEGLFSKLNLTAPETIWYQSFDGRRIQAWVQRPPGFEEGKRYPLILNIHGGPHAAYGFTFDHEFQWMAAKGYVVLYPNPRGSTSYGQEFGNVIQYHYPGDDYRDLMAGVDELIKRGWADPDKLGVTGGSGGGVLTNWTIGHTGRFKAAVSQRSIADWRDFWYTADFTLFTSMWFRGAPWEDEADFKARSPITYVEKITTPLMLVEGEADLRTPPGAGGEQMFRALKYLKRPVVMVRFPGETHELSRSGKPTHRVERLRHIVAWMDKYLMGRETRDYDLQ